MTDNKNNTPEKQENPFLRSFTDKKIQELQEGFEATNYLADLQAVAVKMPTTCDDGETPITDDLFVEVPYDDARAERIGYSNYSYWGSTLRVFLKNKISVAVLIFLVAVLLFTFIQPYLPNQFDPYVVNNDENGKLFAKYQDLAANEKAIFFGGRLGEYKYYDMDQVIDAALHLADTEL